MRNDDYEKSGDDGDSDNIDRDGKYCEDNDDKEGDADGDNHDNDNGNDDDDLKRKFLQFSFAWIFTIFDESSTIFDSGFSCM